MTGATRARWTGRGARGFLDKRKGLVNFKEKVIFLQTVKKMCFMPKKRLCLYRNYVQYGCCVHP